MTDGPAILLVDDDPDDVELTCHAFRRAGFENRIVALRTKDAAFDYLRGTGQYADRASFPLPHLVLLDHKTPDGEWQFVEWVRTQPGFRKLPVAILTGSENPQDEKKAVELGVNAYHRKPYGFENLVELIQRIAEFWLPFGASAARKANFVH
jgi:CheY-like chemotaxis protein